MSPITASKYRPWRRVREGALSADMSFRVTGVKGECSLLCFSMCEWELLFCRRAKGCLCDSQKPGSIQRTLFTAQYYSKRMPNPQCFWVLSVCVCIPHSTQSIPSEYLDPHFSNLTSCAISISFQDVFFPQWYLLCYLPLSPLHSLLYAFKSMCLSSLFLELAL